MLHLMVLEMFLSRETLAAVAALVKRLARMLITMVVEMICKRKYVRYS